MMWNRIVILFCFLTLALTAHAWAEEGPQTVAYQMAYIHTQYLKPENIVLGRKIQPESAVIAEFQWILDGMRYRCVNPQPYIATAIIESWKVMRKNGKDVSLLSVARDLSKLASNISIFGRERVDFGTICQYWLGQKLGKKKP